MHLGNKLPIFLPGGRGGRGQKSSTVLKYQYRGRTPLDAPSMHLCSSVIKLPFDSLYLSSSFSPSLSLFIGSLATANWFRSFDVSPRLNLSATKLSFINAARMNRREVFLSGNLSVLKGEFRTGRISLGGWMWVCIVVGKLFDSFFRNLLSLLFNQFGVWRWNFEERFHSWNIFLDVLKGDEVSSKTKCVDCSKSLKPSSFLGCILSCKQSL